MMVCLMLSLPWNILNNLLCSLPFFLHSTFFILQVLAPTISPPSLLMSSPVLPLSTPSILKSHFIALRPFHHLPVFWLYLNSLTSLPSGVFDRLTSLLSLCPTLPSHFLLTPISHSIIIAQQQSCLPPIWTVLKSQQTQISLLPIHQSPFSMMFIFPFINQFPL